MNRVLLPLGVLLLGQTALFAEAKTSGDWTYTTNEAGEATITGYKGAGGEVVVPAEIDGLPVRHLGDGVFANPGPLPEGVPAEAAGPQIGSVKLPDGVATIGPGAFANCGALTDIAVSPENPAFSTIDGVLFDKEGKTLVRFPAGKAGNYAVPESVTAIAPGAFDGAAAVEKVEFPPELASRLDSLGLPAELLAKLQGDALPVEEKADAASAEEEKKAEASESPGDGVIAELTVGEITYEDVSLKKEFPQSLFIKHAGGMTFVERGDLSEEQIASLVGSAQQ